MNSLLSKEKDLVQEYKRILEKQKDVQLEAIKGKLYADSQVRKIEVDLERVKQENDILIGRFEKLTRK